MIPKIIHYCWFGGKELPIEVKKCIASWRKMCPDYEIIRWDESNFDVGQHPFVREAYKAKVLKDFDRVAKLGGFADENAFNEYLTETKNDVAAFGQELADRGLSLHEKPVLGSPNKDGVSAGVESYIQAKAAEAANKGLGGKEV